MTLIPAADEQSWLDRFACGELDDGERRTLLSWLDADPRRWKRCALAMLEAQLWSESFELLKSENPADPGATVARVAGPVVRGPGRWPRRSAMLAIVLTIFAIGYYAGSSAARQDTDRFAETPNRIVEEPVGHSSRTVKSNSPDKHEKGASRIADGKSPGPPKHEVPLTPTRALTIHSEEYGDLQLPVVDCPILAREIVSNPPRLPESFVEQWARRGYLLKQNRMFVPVDVGEGRRLVVPVDRYEMQYVGNSST